MFEYIINGDLVEVFDEQGNYLTEFLIDDAIEFYIENYLLKIMKEISND